MTATLVGSVSLAGRTLQLATPMRSAFESRPNNNNVNNSSKRSTAASAGKDSWETVSVAKVKLIFFKPGRFRIYRKVNLVSV